MEPNSDQWPGLNRADFLKNSSIAFALSACPLLIQCANMEEGAEADPGVSFTSTDEGISVSSGTLNIDLTSSAGQTLQSNGAIVITDQSLLVTHQSGSYKGFSNSCTHQGGAVNPVGTGLMCSLHSGVFDYDGVAISGPPSVGLASKTISISGNTLSVTL
jgi:Rieske Fe-S protein